MRVALYARLSDDRGGTSTGVDRQLEACRQYAAAQGWEIVAEYSDSDLSAFRRGVVRPGYNEMLEHLAEVDAVLVWKLDRLVRRFLEFARIWPKFQEASVAIVSATEPIDTGSAVGRIIVLMLVGFAELESETIGLRQRAKHAELARMGKDSGGGRNAYPDHIVVEASERIAAGETVYAVARDLGVHGSHLKRALQSPRLVGRRQGQEVENGPLRQIVPIDTWNAVQTVLARPSRYGTSQQRRHLLTGFLVCGRCGERLQVNMKHGRQRYLCKRPGCGAVSIEKKRVEDLVAEGVLGLVDSSKLPKLTFEDAALEARIRADEEALAELTRARYVERILGDEEFRRSRDELVSRIRKLEGLRNRASLPQMQGKAREAWASADLSWRRSLLGAVLERVVVRPATRRGGPSGSQFDPSRVEPTFRS